MEHLLEDRKKLVCEEDRVSSDKRLDACQQFTKEVQNKTERISSESKSGMIGLGLRIIGPTGPSWTVHVTDFWPESLAMI